VSGKRRSSKEEHTTKKSKQFQPELRHANMIDQAHTHTHCHQKKRRSDLKNCQNHEPNMLKTSSQKKAKVKNRSMSEKVCSDAEPSADVISPWMMLMMKFDTISTATKPCTCTSNDTLSPSLSMSRDCRGRTSWI
jgi:hypothetical protein